MGRPAFFRQLFLDSFRSVAPALYRPEPAGWSSEKITGSCLGHSTVLLNILGTWVLTDPVFSTRIGLGFGPFVIGPKRYLRPALAIHELPRPDLILLSHAHFDHLDLPSLRRFPKDIPVVTATATRDLLGHFQNVQELAWGGMLTISGLRVSAFEVNHWGARMIKDEHRGWNGYLVEKDGRQIGYAGDTATTDAFAQVRVLAKGGPDLMLMPIGAYDPWIRAHCTPEQAYAMAREAGAKHFVPVHHQTFRLSSEPMDEPGQRIRAAFASERGSLLAVDIGETFVVP